MKRDKAYTTAAAKANQTKLEHYVLYDTTVDDREKSDCFFVADLVEVESYFYGATVCDVIAPI